MREVMRAYFAKEPLVVVGQLTPCAKLQVCSRTTGGFMRHWMPDVHLMWSEGVAHLLNESCRLGSILKPVCGPRVHGSRHDGDPSIKKMPTSKKIANVVICHSSSNTVPQKKKMVLSPWMPRRQHGCDFSDSKCLLMDPEVCAGSHHGQRRTTYEGVRYAIRKRQV